MKLYYVPGACSLAPHIALREAGLAFTLDKMDPATRRTADGEDYLKLNPKASVPALRLDNDEVLTEAAVILQYIADQKPDTGLAPAAGGMEGYRLHEGVELFRPRGDKPVNPVFHPNLAPA